MKKYILKRDLPLYYEIGHSRFNYSGLNNIKTFGTFYFDTLEGARKIADDCEEDLKIIFNV